MYFYLNPPPTVSQVCQTLAILTSVVLLDSHWKSEKFLSKLCSNKYNTRHFSSSRKCEETEEDHLSKIQE